MEINFIPPSSVFFQEEGKKTGKKFLSSVKIPDAKP